MTKKNTELKNKNNEINIKIQELEKLNEGHQKLIEELKSKKDEPKKEEPKKKESKKEQPKKEEHKKDFINHSNLNIPRSKYERF